MVKLTCRYSPTKILLPHFARQWSIWFLHHIIASHNIWRFFLVFQLLGVRMLWCLSREISNRHNQCRSYLLPLISTTNVVVVLGWSFMSGRRALDWPNSRCPKALVFGSTHYSWIWKRRVGELPHVRACEWMIKIPRWLCRRIRTRSQ